MLKKFIAFLIILIFSINGFSISSMQIQKNEIIIQENFEFSKLNIDFSSDYSIITIDETNTIISKPNKPILPAYKKTYIYPYETIIKDIEFIIKSDIYKEKIPKKLQYYPNNIPPTNQLNINDKKL